MTWRDLKLINIRYSIMFGQRPPDDCPLSEEPDAQNSASSLRSSSKGTRVTGKLIVTSPWL